MGIDQAFRAGLMEGMKRADDRYRTLAAERDELLTKVAELEVALMAGVGPKAANVPLKAVNPTKNAGPPVIASGDTA